MDHDLGYKRGDKKRIMKENKDNNSSIVVPKQTEEVCCSQVRHVVHVKEKVRFHSYSLESSNELLFFCLVALVPQSYRPCCVN